MASATVAQPQPVSKAFYSIFHERHGVLGKLDGEILFLDSEDESLTVIEPPDFPWIAVLGEVGLADCQQIMDRLHGGYAQIACTRTQMEVGR